MMAGEGPDVALFVGYTDPVNLAARGAVRNLAAFDGFSEGGAALLSLRRHPLPV